MSRINMSLEHAADMSKRFATAGTGVHSEWTVMNVGCEHFLIQSIALLIITPIIRHYDAFIQLGLYRCGIFCR